MKMLLDDADLKPPEAIFVSPLQRALQTAAVMCLGLQSQLEVCRLLDDSATRDAVLRAIGTLVRNRTSGLSLARKP